MSFRHFAEEIRKELPAPAYLFISSDPFLLSEGVNAVKALIPESERDFLFHAFDLMNLGEGGISFDQILDVLNTIPFFAGRKFVVVENLQKLLKKDQKKLDAYLLSPSETTVLVLLNAGALKKEMRDAMKGVKQFVLDLRERDIPAWLKAKAGQKGIQLSDDAADYLLGVIGPDLGLLSSELEKSALLGKSRVEKRDFLEIVEGKRSYGAFDLINAIMSRDREKVFQIYRVIRETEEPYSLLGALNWQYGKLSAGGKSPRARSYYRRVFEILHKADLDVKSSGGAYPVELLLVRLLRLSGQR